MTNDRVTPAGMALGRSTAKLATVGRKLLADAGLMDMHLPTVRNEMCKSCACRPGTVPNGCEQTQMDFLKAIIQGDRFLCHAPKDGRVCAGWVAARAAVAEKPIPIELRLLVACYEYSPPDSETEKPAERQEG